MAKPALVALTKVDDTWRQAHRHRDSLVPSGNSEIELVRSHRVDVYSEHLLPLGRGGALDLDVKPVFGKKSSTKQALLNTTIHFASRDNKDDAMLLSASH